MSILRKIPKIEQVLDNMSIESLKRLESLMNSGNGATETYTLFGGENKLNYVNKDLGVWYCNIELERNKSVETGFLIWESQTKALFVSYDITQCLKEYGIDLTNYTYTKINEKLSIEEFRRVLEDNINKEVVHIDTTGNVEVGKNLVVGGKVILNGKEDLVDTSGNVLISGSSGSSKVWYELPNLFFLENITQKQFDEIKNLALQNQLAGINCGGIYCPLVFCQDGQNIAFFYPWYDNGFTAYQILLNIDLSVVTIPYSTIALPQTAPTSQVIPSITTYDEQQNLTIGDGLVIENGALKTTIPPLPADASTKTYTLKAVNGVLTWVEG